MNLTDYERVARTFFGDCPGCDECNACRVQTLIAQVWESGRRSGAADSAKTHGRKTLWQEWSWDAGMLERLVSHALKVCPEWCFTCRDDAAVFTRNQMERAEEWARAGGHRKTDWEAFMQTWIRRASKEMERGVPRQSRQADLFGQSSALPSGPSSRDAEREDTLERAMTLSAGTGRR